MTDPATNLPVGYTEANFFGTVGGDESFPITLKAGVSIVGSGGPVYVYSQNAAASPVLFKAPAGAIQFGNLQLIGGATAVEAIGGAALDLTLQQVTFANCTGELRAEHRLPLPCRTDGWWRTGSTPGGHGG